MTDFALPGFDPDAFVRATLAEDLGRGGDITSLAVIPADARFEGLMDSRDADTVAGLPTAQRFLRAHAPAMEIEIPVGEEARRGGNAGGSTGTYQWSQAKRNQKTKLT